MRRRFGESRRPDDHFARALLDQRARPLHRADAAAHARSGIGGQHAHQFVIEPRPMAASRSMT